MCRPCIRAFFVGNVCFQRPVPEKSDIHRGSGGDRTLAYRLRAGCSTLELQIQFKPLPRAYSARWCGREELNLQAYGGRFTAVGAHQCPASTNSCFRAGAHNDEGRLGFPGGLLEFVVCPTISRIHPFCFEGYRSNGYHSGPLAIRRASFRAPLYSIALILYTLP